MTRLVKTHSNVWLKAADVSKPSASPSQVDFYALLGAAYLLLIVGGIFAICLSVMSQTAA